MNPRSNNIKTKSEIIKKVNKYINTYINKNEKMVNKIIIIITKKLFAEYLI